jgi:hypothetical protein
VELKSAVVAVFHIAAIVASGFVTIVATGFAAIFTTI